MSKLQAPNWCKDAVATARGWENKETGEVYVSNRFLLSDSVIETPAIEPAVEVKKEVVEPAVEVKKEVVEPVVEVKKPTPAKKKAPVKKKATKKKK